MLGQNGCGSIGAMKGDIIYIFGKHAVYEALTQRPELIVELYIEHGFNDEKMFSVITLAAISPRILNPKKLPGPGGYFTLLFLHLEFGVCD